MKNGKKIEKESEKRNYKKGSTVTPEGHAGVIGSVAA